MSSITANPINTGPTGFSKYIPHILMTIGGIIMLTNTVLLGVSLGNTDTANDLKKYVAVSFVPVIVSLVLTGIGLKLYFTQYPSYLPYAAVILALLALGVSNASLCISLIDKRYS